MPDAAPSPAVVLSDRDSIDTYMLIAARGRMRLEAKGIRFKGPALAPQLRKRFGWTGNKQAIINQLSAEIERRQAARAAL